MAIYKDLKIKFELLLKENSNLNQAIEEQKTENEIWRENYIKAEKKLVELVNFDERLNEEKIKVEEMESKMKENIKENERINEILEIKMDNDKTINSHKILLNFKEKIEILEGKLNDYKKLDIEVLNLKNSVENLEAKIKRDQEEITGMNDIIEQKNKDISYLKYLFIN